MSLHKKAGYPLIFGFLFLCLCHYQNQNKLTMTTNYDPKLHHRSSIRLKGYDYSLEGLYFVTICVQNMECIFGEIKNSPLVGAGSARPLQQ